MDRYKPGNYHVICDQCAQKKYRSECRFTWDGLLVCIDSCWEPKHPQLFVKAKADMIRVPDPRPDSQEITRSTTLSGAASKGDLTVDLTSVANLSQYDSLSIVLDDDPISGSSPVFTTYAKSISTLTVTLGEKMPGSAASGNAVYVTGSNYLSTTEVSATDL